MNGIILINKQSGRTSHDEVAIIKSALRSIGCKSKVGHSGTLDPKVTGLLVVGIGTGTRMLEYMLLSEKKYTGVIEFHKEITRSDLEKAIKFFTGTITQLPPQKSSVKRQEREREVYGLEIKEFDPAGRYAVLECAVERGTYIRKLFHDMGQYMDVGAHMGDLHRTHVGPFHLDSKELTSNQVGQTIKNTKSLLLWKRIFAKKKLEQKLLPIGKAVPSFTQVILHPGVERYIASGGDIFVPGIDCIHGDSAKGERVAVFTQKHELVSIAEAVMSTQEIRNSKKGTALRTRKVLI